MPVTDVVLLVEDEPVILLAAAELLSGEGFEVLVASNSEEALAILAQRPETKVVVSDINLGGGRSGLELAWSVAQDMPHTRVILISGEQRPAREQYPEAAIFLTKPYAPGALVSLTRQDPALLQA